MDPHLPSPLSLSLATSFTTSLHNAGILIIFANQTFFMKLKLDFISILLIVLTMLLPTGHLHAAPLTSAAARVVNTSIGRDKTLISSLRDRYGFLWVGTTTGLACYDGNGERPESAGREAWPPSV